MAPWIHDGELPLLFFESRESSQDALRRHRELRHAHAHRVLDGIGDGCSHWNDWRLTHSPGTEWAKLRGDLYQQRRDGGGILAQWQRQIEPPPIW